MNANENLIDIARKDPQHFTEIINKLDLAFAEESARSLRELGADARESYVEVFGTTTQ